MVRGPSRFVRASLVFIMGLLAACGDRVTVLDPPPAPTRPIIDGEDPPDADPSLAPRIALMSEACGDALLVPGGTAYVVGYAELDANARPTAAMCGVDGSGAWLGRQLGDVYLMRDIVRTDCKRACIADGACDEPTHEDGLTFTRYENRARLCAWLGGRIPNLWELARAARGDAIAPAGEELMSTYFACFDQTLAAGALNGVSDTCAELFGELWANQASPLELLHGPWGHEGLYVGAEVSSSVVPAAAFEPGTGLVNFCRDTPQDAGVDAEGRRIDFDPAASLIRIWERLGTPRTFFRDPGYRGPGNNPTFAWRCAFDPPEE